LFKGARVFRVCSVPGCPTIHDGATGSRCPSHYKAARRTRNQKTSVYKTAGHTKRFRPGVLDRDPICVLCNIRASTVADHYPKSREELVALGFDPDDPKHGRGLCKPCHDSETAKNQPGGWNNRDQ
jgi:5-methylcytosine-specific restriction protein A